MSPGIRNLPNSNIWHADIHTLWPIDELQSKTIRFHSSHIHSFAYITNDCDTYSSMNLPLTTHSHHIPIDDLRPRREFILSCDAWQFILILVHIVNSQKSFNDNNNNGNGTQMKSIRNCLQCSFFYLPSSFFLFLYLRFILDAFILDWITGWVSLYLYFAVYVCGYESVGPITIRSKLNNNWFLLFSFLGFYWCMRMAELVDFGGVFQFLSFLSVLNLSWNPLGHISNIIMEGNSIKMPTTR